MTKQLHFLQCYTITTTLLLGVLSLAAFKRSGESMRLAVDSFERASISFLDSQGQVTRTIADASTP